MDCPEQKKTSPSATFRRTTTPSGGGAPPPGLAKAKDTEMGSLGGGRSGGKQTSKEQDFAVG